jgi:hypothetical protein
MANGSAVGIQDVVVRLEQLRGFQFWKVWRSIGSHLFFDTGEPLITASEHLVKRRSHYVRGSHGMHVEMAAWTVSHEGQQVAHSESCDSVSRARPLALWSVSGECCS